MPVDVIYLIAVLFAVVIAVAAAIYITNQLFAGLNQNPSVSSCPSCQTALAKGQAAQSLLANAIVLVFLLMCFASVILAAFLDSSPIFLVLEFIIVPIELLVSFVFHDAFFQIAQTSFIGTTLTSIPLIGVLFTYLPVLVLVIVVIVSLITFMR